MSSQFHQVLSMVLREFGSHVVSVTMYGSRVKSCARLDSDYDMIIIMERLDLNPNVREEFVASAIARILLTSGLRISPLVLTKEEAIREAQAGSPLLVSVLSDYEMLHDPTRFMAELLDLTKRSRSSLTYYFRKAQADLESAKHLSSVAQYANTVFLAQQCAEKAAKATLAMKNIEVREHIVSGYLASEVVAFAPEMWEDRLREVVRMLVSLEEHSIRPRYPFVTASRIWDPEKGYDRQAAEDAVQKAQTILKELEEFCESNLAYLPGDATI